MFGPRQDPDGAYAAVIPKWVAAMLRAETVYINGDGETARDFCYIDNVVQVNLLAALVRNPAALNQVYNVAVGEQTSLNQLFGLLREFLALNDPEFVCGDPAYRDFRPGDVRFSRADIAKAKRLLGYRPTHRVREVLERAIDWYVARLAPATKGGEALVPPAGVHPEPVSNSLARMGHSFPAAE